jgi:hypothetical protein
MDTAFFLLFILRYELNDTKYTATPQYKFHLSFAIWTTKEPDDFLVLVPVPRTRRRSNHKHTRHLADICRTTYHYKSWALPPWATCRKCFKIHKLKWNLSDKLHIPDPALIYGELSNVCKQENAHSTLRIIKCPIIDTQFKPFCVKWIQPFTWTRRYTTPIINLILLVNIQLFWHRTRCWLAHRYWSPVSERLKFCQVRRLNKLGLCQYVCLSVCLTRATQKCTEQWDGQNS